MNEHECGLLTLSRKGQPEVLGIRSLSQSQRVHGEKTATNCLMAVPVVMIILRRFIPVVVFLAVETHAQLKYI